MLRCMLELCRVHVFLIVWLHVSDGACLDNSTVIIIEMTGLHGSLRYVVYIFMNAAFIFCPNEHVLQRLSSLVGYNWWIFEYVSQQRLILYELPVLHQYIFKVTHRWVVRCKKRQDLFFFSCVWVNLLVFLAFPKDLLKYFKAWLFVLQRPPAKILRNLSSLSRKEFTL